MPNINYQDPQPYSLWPKSFVRETPPAPPDWWNNPEYTPGELSNENNRYFDKKSFSWPQALASLAGFENLYDMAFDPMNAAPDAGQQALAEVLGVIDGPGDNMALKGLSSLPFLGAAGTVPFANRPHVVKHIFDPMADRAMTPRDATKFKDLIRSDIPSPTPALPVMEAMEGYTGIKTLNHGIEWEGRGPLKFWELEDYFKDVHDRGLTKNRIMVEEEGALPEYENFPWADHFVHPAEIIDKPYEGLEGVRYFANTAGPIMQTPYPKKPLFKGGPYDGGGHVSVSPPNHQWDLEHTANFIDEVTRKEPWWYPSNPLYKWSPERGMVPPSYSKFKKMGPTEYYKKYPRQFNTIEDLGTLEKFDAAFKTGGAKEDGTLDGLLATDPTKKRIELRGFLSPEDYPEWVENMAITQAMWNSAAVRPFKSNALFNLPQDDFARAMANYMKRNQEELLSTHRGQILAPGYDEMISNKHSFDEYGRPQNIEDARSRFLNQDPWLDMIKDPDSILKPTWKRKR